MINLRLFLFAILGSMLLPSLGVAQVNSVATAADSLHSVLSNLEDSVEQLGVANDQLANKDKYFKDQILQLQMQLGQLEAQGDVLTKKVGKLQEINPSRAEQIARLENENADLDNRTQKVGESIKLIQQSLDTGFQEDQRLLLQLKELASPKPAAPAVQTPEVLAAQSRQKEKLRLIKMIYESQQRQDALHESILEFQKNTVLTPGASAFAHQQILKEQIKTLEDQLSAYPPERENAGITDRWDDDQLRQLEVELKVLEKNYLQLKDLLGKMTKKAQEAQATVSQHVEDEKMQNKVDSLNRQGEGLRADLDDLRSQMVDLDKRKSHLEDMIRQLP